MEKIIVAGSRGLTDYEFVKTELDKLLPKNKKVEIVCGGARGADALGKQYAAEHNLSCHTMNAEWNKYGRRAGYIRNQAMAEYADKVIVFWDGKSNGSRHMINIANEKKMPLRIIRYEEE